MLYAINEGEDTTKILTFHFSLFLKLGDITISFCSYDPAPHPHLHKKIYIYSLFLNLPILFLINNGNIIRTDALLFLSNMIDFNMFFFQKQFSFLRNDHLLFAIILLTCRVFIKALPLPLYNCHLCNQKDPFCPLSNIFVGKKKISTYWTHSKTLRISYTFLSYSTFCIKPYHFFFNCVGIFFSVSLYWLYHIHPYKTDSYCERKWTLAYVNSQLLSTVFIKLSFAL